MLGKFVSNPSLVDMTDRNKETIGEEVEDLDSLCHQMHTTDLRCRCTRLLQCHPQVTTCRHIDRIWLVEEVATGQDQL